MKTKIFLIFLIFASTPYVMAEQISFETDINYKKNDQSDFTPLKGGEKIDLKRGESVFIISQKNIPLLIVSANNSDAKLVVPDTSLNAGVMEMILPQIEKSTEEIVESLRNVEALIQKRDYSQASQIVSLLRQKYKKNSSVLFISASIRYLQNDRTNAINDLQEGLQINPTNENAKKFLSKLKGGS